MSLLRASAMPGRGSGTGVPRQRPTLPASCGYSKWRWSRPTMPAGDPCAEVFTAGFPCPHPRNHAPLPHAPLRRCAPTVSCHIDATAALVKPSPQVRSFRCEALAPIWHENPVHSSLPARSRTRSGGFRAGMGRVEAAFVQGFGGPRPGSRRIAATKLYDAHGAPTRSRSRAPIAISSDVQPRRAPRDRDSGLQTRSRGTAKPADRRKAECDGGGHAVTYREQAGAAPREPAADVR